MRQAHAPCCLKARVADGCNTFPAGWIPIAQWRAWELPIWGSRKLKRFSWNRGLANHAFFRLDLLPPCAVCPAASLSTRPVLASPSSCLSDVSNDTPPLTHASPSVLNSDDSLVAIVGPLRRKDVEVCGSGAAAGTGSAICREL